MDELQTEQQINLYLPEYRPRNDWMSVARAIQILGGTFLVIVVLSGYQLWQRASLQSELAAKDRELVTQTNITERVERTLAGRATDQGLISEISTRETNLAQIKETLEIMQSVELGNASGFSEHLMNVSQASSEGLWLTNLHIRNGGSRATMTGFVTESHLVPNFVDRLSTGWTESAGWRFSQMTTEIVPTEDGSGNLHKFLLEAQ